MTKKKVKEVVEEVVEPEVVDEAHLQRTIEKAFAYSDQHAGKAARINVFRAYLEREYRFINA